MPFNGAGLFSRVYQWINDEALGIFVDATRTDTDSNDIASGLSNCVTRNGQSPWFTNLPAGGFKITGLGAGGVAGDSVNYGQVFTNPVFTNASSAGTVPITDNSLKYATTAFVVATAFGAALPNQAGHAGQYVKTDGTTAGWSYITLVRQARTSNTNIAVTDANTMIDYTVGNFTQRFSLSSVLGNGFNMQTRNSTTSDGVEVEAPAVNTVTSVTSNSIAAGTTWQIATGLTIGAGDLVNVRRTADGYNQRIIGVAASYNPATGALVVTPNYRIGSGTFTDWTITTRPVTMGIDGVGSFVLWPGEVRQWQTDGVGFTTSVLCGYKLITSVSMQWVKPTMYREFAARVTGGGSSGQKSGNVGTPSSGGSGGGGFLFTIPASSLAAMELLSPGAGGAAQAAVAAGNPGGNSTFGSNFVVYANTNARIGGSIRPNLAATGSQPTGFEAGGQGAGTQNNSIWGGAGSSTDGTASGSSIYGGPAGGSMTAAAAVTAPGTNILNAVGGVASSTGSGVSGTGAGAGGGATQTGAQSGAGIGGEIQHWGIV